VNEAALLAARQVKRRSGKSISTRPSTGWSPAEEDPGDEREGTGDRGHPRAGTRWRRSACRDRPGGEGLDRLARDRGTGLHAAASDEDRTCLPGRSYSTLCVLLGGRTAEEIVFGDVSTGAQNDLQRATDLVRHMVTQYGMSEKVGLMTYDGADGSAYCRACLRRGTQ